MDNLKEASNEKLTAQTTPIEYSNGHIECVKTTTHKYFDIQCTSTSRIHFFKTHMQRYHTLS